MYNDKGSDEDLDIISSPEVSDDTQVVRNREKTCETEEPKSESEDEETVENQHIYDANDHDQIRGFNSILSSEIYIVEVNNDTVLYSNILGHARRQAYKMVQNIMFSQPTWYTYHIDQPDHNTFILNAVSKWCLVSYDNHIATVSIRPLYKVRESQW